MEQPTPTFIKLVKSDKNFQIACFMAVGSPIALAAPLIRSDELLNMNTIILAGIGIVGAIWLAFQYFQVMTTFREGITVKGTLIYTERKTQPRLKNRHPSYSHYAFIRYSFNNETFEKRFKLPGQPEKYGLEKGMTLDLILREEKPKTIFIKKLYLD